MAIEHQLPGAVAVSVAYYHRVIRRDDRVEEHGGADGQLHSAAGGGEEQRPVGDRVQPGPALRGKFDTLWDNVPEMDSDYNGVELNVRKRLSNRWMVMGGMGYGKNTGDIYNLATDRGDLNNPNYTFRRGVLPPRMSRSRSRSRLL